MDKHLTRPFSATADSSGIAHFDAPVTFNLGSTVVSSVNIKTVKVLNPDQSTVELTVRVSKLSIQEILRTRRHGHGHEDWPFSKKNVGDEAYGLLTIEDDETCVVPIDASGCSNPRDPVDLVDCIPPAPPNAKSLSGSSYSVDGKITGQANQYNPGDTVYGLVALIYQVAPPPVPNQKKG